MYKYIHKYVYLYAHTHNTYKCINTYAHINTDKGLGHIYL